MTGRLVTFVMPLHVDDFVTLLDFWYTHNSVSVSLIIFTDSSFVTSCCCCYIYKGIFGSETGNVAVLSGTLGASGEDIDKSTSS